MNEFYRYKLTIEYDGTNYAGWQQQPNLSSIQGHLQKALARLFKINTVVYGAGRTDKGVHALGQVAHFDIPKYYEPLRVKAALNSFLKKEAIFVRTVEAVDSSFHARFSARSRSYIYKIYLSPNRQIFKEGRYWVISRKMDIQAMQIAATYFMGRHDFSAFRAADCQAKSAIKNITDLKINEGNDGELEVYIKAPSFLHNQVRIIVGTLYDVGRGKTPSETIAFLLKQPNRTYTSFTAPACGLYLFEVEY